MWVQKLMAGHDLWESCKALDLALSKTLSKSGSKQDIFTGSWEKEQRMKSVHGIIDHPVPSKPALLLLSVDILLSWLPRMCIQRIFMPAARMAGIVSAS